MSRDIAPLHVWQRHYPTAHRIADELTPPLLALRTRRLVVDICERYRVCVSTARMAVAMARKACHD